jgi:hypothetical protein
MPASTTGRAETTCSGRITGARRRLNQTLVQHFCHREIDECSHGPWQLPAAKEHEVHPDAIDSVVWKYFFQVPCANMWRGYDRGQQGNTQAGKRGLEQGLHGIGAKAPSNSDFLGSLRAIKAP